MKNYIKQAPVTAAIVAVCFLAWAVTAIQSRSLSGSYYDSSLAYAWTLWGPEFAAAPATAITAGFMHIDVGHLTLNKCLLDLAPDKDEKAHVERQMPDVDVHEAGREGRGRGGGKLWPPQSPRISQRRVIVGP